jgi:two-component system NarL family response regulator
MAKKRSVVCVADPRDVVRQGFEARLEKEKINVVGVRTVKAAKETDADLYLVSMSMNGDPFALATKLAPKGVVMYADQANDSIMDVAVKIGARGVFTTTEGLDQIVVGVKCLLDDGEEMYMSSDLSQRLVKTRGLQPRSRLSTLSPRERAVLCHLAEDYSVQDTAKILEVAPTTVETHRQSIRAKLDIRGAAGMCRFAIREGLMEA